MAETFDPYHLWLGIPPKDQPPNYYRLLGLHLFESDADVIAHAADARINHIRSFCGGPYGAWAERLLQEIGAAKACLLVPAKKAQYDAQLRTQLSMGSPARGFQPSNSGPPTGPELAELIPPRNVPIPLAQPVPPPTAALVQLPQSGPSQKSSVGVRYISRRKSWESILLGGGILLSVGVVVLAVLVVSMVDRQASTKVSQQTARSDRHEKKGKLGGEDVAKDTSSPASGTPQRVPQAFSVPSKKPLSPPPSPFQNQPPEAASEKTPPDPLPPPSHKPEEKPLSNRSAMRIWRDRTGKPLCQARFGELRGNLVELVDQQDKYRTIPLEELCEEDRRCIDQILDIRGQTFILLLSTVPVTTTIETASLVSAGIPLDENRQFRILGIYKQKYELEEEIPVSRTLEELKTGLSYFLRGKTLRLKAKVTQFKSSENTIEFDLSEAWSESGLSRFWRPVFRTSITPPSAFLENLQLRVGDTIYFQGEFDLTIETCPKCRGTGRRNCPECLNGFKQKTVLLPKVFPDGKKIMFPGQIQIPCARCGGASYILCDHYIIPKQWNPASSGDKTRWIIGQLHFSRAHLLQETKVNPKSLYQIQLYLARDTAYALCFHLKDMEVGVISRGEKKAIIQPKKSQ